MSGNVGISRLWPAPTATPLDSPALIALYPRADRPHLRMNFVTSVDGAVELDGHSAGLSSGPDKRVFGLLRMLCDVLLVGAGTLRHEGYRGLRLDERRRAWRREHGLAEYPTLVVVSRTLHLDPESAAFADAPVRPVVLTTGRAEAPAGLAGVAELLRRGEEQVDLAAGLAELHRRGQHQLLCEGGPHLFGSLTAAGLVDEVCLTVAPMLTGPGAGRITAGPTTRPHGMTLRHVLAAGDELLLRYVRE
ncbi:pyrimidine reductase family protein [Micromonospora sp. WMMD1102]|uniref:pyrimidine reductase family protein n=1 Tax=Micromonospora sp. WMMD1102 TaxID=3016105 RepID=UPI002414F989|nr:pyrimidine reductase family protein [Micromonospora sp. WMMD1102]MDG4785905.1 pyrimidine reductase family protein [Micromonospora sp. WMMD1102]